ncbi:MAG: hypothetical protein AAB347_09650, partial [Bacteroidota bacterium]
VTPVTVTCVKLNEPVPPVTWALVLKVAPPALKTLELLLVIQLLKIKRVEKVDAVEVQVPPGFIVTNPVKVFTPVLEDMVRVPVTEVVPETVIAKAPTVRVDALAILRLVQAAVASTVTVNPPSIKTLSAATGAVAPGIPPEVADHTAVEVQAPLATEKRSADIATDTDVNKTTTSTIAFTGSKNFRTGLCVAPGRIDGLNRV